MAGKRSNFDDHMSALEQGSNTKVASLGNKGSILSKLAQELGEMAAPSEAAPATGAAPVAEGQVFPGGSTVAGASPTVVSVTESVTTPQVIMAGGAIEEAVAGEVPGATKPNTGVVISAGDGRVTDANQLHKTPNAVATAATSGDGEKQAALAQAEAVGEAIAASFMDSLQKHAMQQEYRESLAILKTAGLLDGYNIVDDIETDKTASQADSVFAKIANLEVLSHQDIISAGAAVVDYLSKEASDESVTESEKVAYEQGIRDAVDYMVDLQKEAQDEDAVKIAMQDPQVTAAVAVLKSKGLL